MTNRITRGEALVGKVAATGGLTAGGTIDLGSPVENIADPTGGDTQDDEARTAIEAILDALETVGIMAEAE